jgi:hypothetical protein
MIIMTQKFSSFQLRINILINLSIFLWIFLLPRHFTVIWLLDMPSRKQNVKILTIHKVIMFPLNSLLFLLWKSVSSSGKIKQCDNYPKMTITEQLATLNLLNKMYISVDILQMGPSNIVLHYSVLGSKPLDTDCVFTKLRSVYHTAHY